MCWEASVGGREGEERRPGVGYVGKAGLCLFMLIGTILRLLSSYWLTGHSAGLANSQGMCIVPYQPTVESYKNEAQFW